MKTLALVTPAEKCVLEIQEIELREMRSNDVHIQVICCGICHTDVHYMGNDWKTTVFPLVCGHEVIGRVVKVGEDVTGFSPGQRVGVGFSSWSCRDCEACLNGQENYCPKMVPTLSGQMPDGEITKGGWARDMIVPAEFLVTIPDSVPSEFAAPLLCAGITVYSPMTYFKMGKGTKLGVVGVGGLGHLAISFGVALGCEVTAMGTSPSKEPLAKKLGATKFVNTKDAKQMEEAENSLNYIIDTAPGDKDVEPFLRLLKQDGVFVPVALPEKHCNFTVAPSSLIFRRLGIQGSLTGSVKEIQEMFLFAGEHNIRPMIEQCNAPDLNSEIARLMKGDVRFRLVVDIEKTLTVGTDHNF